MASREPLWKTLKRGKPSARALLMRFGMTEPPVDVHGLARHLGVKVYGIKDKPWDGFLDTRTDPAEIWINEDRPWERQRFSMAHEIGHLILHPGPAYRDITFRGSDREAQANGYAANLLMPMWMLAPIAHTYNFDPKALASLFEVSVGAMDIRVMKLIAEGVDDGDGP